jgi:hypothetical protein
VQQQARLQGGDLPQTVICLLRELIGALAATDALRAQILQLQFGEGRTAQEVATRLHISSSNYFLHQKNAIRALTAALLTREEAARAQQHQILYARLGGDSQQPLIAIEAPLAKLVTMLDPTSPYWLVALTGIGGIGKTALADALVRRAIDHGSWRQVAWVTARQAQVNPDATQGPQRALTPEALVQQLYVQLMPEQGSLPAPEVMTAQLRERLRQEGHLIVVDNLEEPADFATLLPTVRTLVNPSKVLFTSRVSLFHEPDLAHLALGELGESEVLQLVRQQATVRNLPEVAAAGDHELQPIYASVGGNPLAIRLVIGLLHTFALADILHDLSAKQGVEINQLYRYIYQKAWLSLEEAARQTLLAMLMSPEGGAPLDYLEHVNPALALAELRTALHHLVKVSLVERRGDLHTARYAIHNLTRTFLHEVVEW